LLPQLTVANDIDSDGDGISDADEIARGRNPQFNESNIITIINSLLLDD
jgi:hypothetical protein